MIKKTALYSFSTLINHCFFYQWISRSIHNKEDIIFTVIFICTLINIESFISEYADDIDMIKMLLLLQLFTSLINHYLFNQLAWIQETFPAPILRKEQNLHFGFWSLSKLHIFSSFNNLQHYFHSSYLLTFDL